MSWYVTKEGKTFKIRNSKTGKRYPRSQYPKETSREALEAFCDRLNSRENRKVIQKIKIKLAFLPVTVIDDFKELLKTEIPNQGNAKHLCFLLDEYVIDFFVNENGLLDPLSWKEIEHKWGLKLLDGKRAVRTIRAIIQVANRFMAYLHKRFPKEIPATKLEPITKAAFKQYGAKIEMKKKPREKFIDEDTFNKILEASGNLASFIELAYRYGLRRSECLALRPEDVRKGYLSVERQYGNEPLKNRLKRQTPHWFSSPQLAYKLTQEALRWGIHPDTLSSKWVTIVSGLGLQFAFHDLRRTFITRALDVATPKQVMLAVGHSNIEITMAYLQDDRDLDDQVYVPKKVS